MAQSEDTLAQLEPALHIKDPLQLNMLDNQNYTANNHCYYNPPKFNNMRRNIK